MSKRTTARTGLGGSYWRLLAGSAISNLGDGVLVVALPLLATTLTDSPFSVGLISAFFTIPWLLLAIPAGAVVDRVDRRTLLVWADLFRAALVGLLALAAAFDGVQLWMLWALAFGLGAGEVFFDSASTAIVPQLVAPEQLERANGWRGAAEVTLNTFVGIPIGSTLFAAAVWLPFGVDAATFVVAAMLAASLRGSFRAQPSSTSTATATTTSMRAEVREGFRWLWNHRLLRSMAIAVALTNLAFAATESTFVLFARDELGVSARMFGVLVGVVGAGALAAGILGAKLVEKVGRRFAILVAAFTPVLTMIAVGILPVVWWVVLMVTVQAMMITLWSIVAVSLRQQLVPQHLFGRVNGVYRWVSWGAMPVGGAAGGLVAAWFGLRAPYFFGAALMALAYLVIVTRLTRPAIAAALADAHSQHLAADEATERDDDATPLSIERDPFDLFNDPGAG
ncbi:MAG TPA: MFS transporter [Acidimicrobiaceae bacterium]|nr:MFS transporter [Acidimicrobiaceae bacterium]